jgi:glycosyltransferase involved in cell wall biosynthesis
MQVLMLSLDREISRPDSAAQKRLVALAGAIGNTPPAEAGSAPLVKGELTVLVSGERDERRLVSKHLTMYSFGGAKIMQLWKMWSKGRRILNPSSDSEVGVLPLEKGELRQRCDLITVQDPYFMGFLAVKLGERFHVPVEVQVHGFERAKGGWNNLARFVLSRATVIRTVSNRLQHNLYSIFHIPYSKIYVLPVYTQTEPSQRPLKRKNVPYPFTFLTIGRLVPVKNVAMQIRAFAKVAAKIPQARLRIVGDGPLLESLKLQVKSLKLEDKIILEGHQENAERFYEEADAFLFTSDSEGWGRVVLEAAAHRLPIIMTDVGLAREVIKNEENGLIIPIQDEGELVRAMQEFLDRPELRARLGEAAFRTFKSLPSREAYIDKQIIAWKRVSSPAANIERTA